jgi:hypothetical protein
MYSKQLRCMMSVALFDVICDAWAWRSSMYFEHICEV